MEIWTWADGSRNRQSGSPGRDNEKNPISYLNGMPARDNEKNPISYLNVPTTTTNFVNPSWPVGTKPRREARRPSRRRGRDGHHVDFRGRIWRRCPDSASDGDRKHKGWFQHFFFFICIGNHFKCLHPEEQQLSSFLKQFEATNDICIDSMFFLTGNKTWWHNLSNNSPS